MGSDTNAAAPAGPALFDLDVSLLELTDPAALVNMTDDGCGQTCEKDTCVTES